MIRLGVQGENKAAIYLKNHGYSILKQNFRTRYGEIDIIGKINNTVVFVEVKTRTNQKKGKPYESVTPRKLKHLRLAINYYIAQKKLYNLKHRLDVISIDYKADNNYLLQHFENLEF